MRDQEIIGLQEAYLEVYEEVDTRRAPKEMLDRLNASREGHMAQDGANKPAYDAKQRLLKKAHKKRTQVSEAKDETEEGITGQPIPKRNLGPAKRHEFEKKRNAERKKRKDPRAGDSLSINRMTGSGGHGSTYQNTRSVREEVLSYLLDEGFASDEKSAEAIMCAMSEAWIGSIVERKHPIMSVTSASGENRSKKRPGATVDSDSYEHENPDQIERRRFSQQLSDRKKKRESEMAAGRLTVATKRGIEKATNRSNDGPGGNEFAPDSALRRREEDDQPTDYRARRRRASGR